MKLKDLFEDSVNVSGTSSNSQFFKIYKETKKWLDKMRIKKYRINKDTLVVDVDDFVGLSNKNIYKIPVKFGKVNGTFSVDNNPNLKSLIGCPNSSTGVSCYSTGIQNFNGLGDVKIVIASIIESLESFEGLPNELYHLDIDGSCHKVNSLGHFPKIINNSVSIGPDFKWFDILYKHMYMCGGICLDGELVEYRNILKLLNVNGIRRISIYNNDISIVTNILTAEIRRQPDPRKRNLLKVAQELSNAGFHYLTT